ncbi:hypothetical protein D3C80_1964260 [compost metagenome]
MVRKEVFEQCEGLQSQAGSDVDLCLAVAQAGQMVVWTPHAQLLVVEMAAQSAVVAQELLARWPSAFSGRAASGQALEWLAQVS